MNYLTFMFIGSLLYLSTTKSKFCHELEGRVKRDFHPLRHCQRSNKSVIAYMKVESLEECSDFAKLNRGLAFNFSPKGREKNFFATNATFESSELEEFYNCEVLDCPEYRNFSSIVNDTRFDYYSLYTRPLPNERALCIPSVGMFVLYNKRSNYSVAYNICKSIDGTLAHIASDIRNVQLSRLLTSATKASVKERNAYIGLNETVRGKFLAPFNEPLECFNYRAWAPGHPKDIRKPGCVALTPDGSWKVFNCNRKLLFICEVNTSGPNPFTVNFNQTCNIKNPNNRFIPKLS
ncbi:CLUMA_CG006987, isoform A [Clunio marinus]|uniref:CLUMA_CG006987, isoform A n=1 Tax=Clunio marinus TaxID=568069 RepID=A0A1J1HZR0_9DIPT|nr:CLUMA_CG006987, isoform A [Clunio marinus]